VTGKYLITTDKFFVAPDGKSYSAVWGEVKILGDETIMGIKTNRQSANWYAQVGGNGREIVIAGCQIFYAVRCEEQPNTDKVEDWYNGPDGRIVESIRPTRIYLAE
jgi:hypothetical protein